ncbi:leucine-rich melanocyte differentiation-associated protein [Anabrus simplex]|uniref:leucine-rich melanocyte differentiation-associated protein n=1 Tax=Anabrus simplex TaxID=316456 RepID=UPI0034DD75E9
MTSLAKLVYVNNRGDDASYITAENKILTLAYENLEEIPLNLVYNFGSSVSTLDISHNQFRCLDFLTQFDNLTSLILDHNVVDSSTAFPSMPSLRLLWLNHNKVASLYPFIRNLHNSCPNLRYLSLMGNTAAPSYLNGGSFYEYLQYRLFVISWFPDLKHLDDRAVTSDQVDEALRLFKRPLLDRFSLTSSYSPYLQFLQNKITSFMASVSFLSSTNNTRNSIV